MAGEFTAAGASVGTAIAPGIGTLIGAGIGSGLDFAQQQPSHHNN